MKATSFALAFTLLLFGCETAEPEQSVKNSGTIPAAALQEPYPDNPNLVLVTLKNGTGGIVSQGNYLNGYRHNSWTEYHPNGVVQSVANYDLGLREGMMIILNNTGQLLETIEYHNDKKSGLSKTYLRSKIKSESFYQNDKLEGQSKLYYDDGAIMEEGSYKSGLRHGISRWYDQAGNLTIEYEYVNGVLKK